MVYTITLYRGTEYVLFAAGDDRIDDLDIYLYDENGNLVDSDSSIDNFPIVQVQPRWTGPFKVEIKNYEGRRGWYHFAIAK